MEGKGSVNEDFFRRVLVFSGINTKLETENFEGMELVTIFGGGESDDSDDEEKDGDSHHNLDEPHTDKVGFAARIAKYRPDYDSNDARYSDGDEANGQRDSAAVYKPAKNVGADIVGAKPVLSIWRLLTDLQIGPAKTIRHRRKDRTSRLARSNHRFVISGVEPARYENKQEYNANKHYKNTYGNLPPQNPCAD